MYSNRQKAYQSDDDRDVLTYSSTTPLRPGIPYQARIPSDADGAIFRGSDYIPDRFILHKCENMYVFLLLNNDWGFSSSLKPSWWFRSGFFMG